MKRHLVIFLGRLALKVVIVGVLLSLSWSNASAQEEDMECEEHVLEMVLRLRLFEPKKGVLVSN